MEKDFGLILLDLVRRNKEKFLGVLRRNGVLVNSKTSSEDLTNMILKAMKKSSTFKTEVITLMTVTMNSDNKDFTNANGDFDFGGGYDFGTPPFQTTSTAPSTTMTPPKDKKDFEDTTVGKVFDKLFKLGDAYLKKEELDVRKAEAQTVAQVSANDSANMQSGNQTPPKSNTGLYIGLGVGGLAIVGLLIYVTTKK